MSLPRMKEDLIRKANIANVKKLIALEHFDPDYVRKIDGNGSCLCAFVLNVMHYYDIRQEALQQQPPARSEPTAPAKALLETAEPYLQAAKAAIDSINKADMMELKCFKRPPAGVDDIFNACNCLVRTDAVNFSKVDTSWMTTQRMISNVVQFFDDLYNVVPRMNDNLIPEANIANVRKLIELEHFDPDAMRKKSSAAAALCAFVLNVMQYYDIRQEALQQQALPQQALPPPPARSEPTAPEKAVHVTAEPTKKSVLATAQPYLKAAKAAIGRKLLVRDLEEIDTVFLEGPPAGVADVFNACNWLVQTDAVDSNVDMSWTAAQKAIQDPSGFLRELNGVIPRIDDDSIPAANIAAVKKLIALEHFKPGQMIRKSSAAAGLCSFVLNVISYHDIRQQALQQPPDRSEPIGLREEEKMSQSQSTEVVPPYVNRDGNPLIGPTNERAQRVRHAAAHRPSGPTCRPTRRGLPTSTRQATSRPHSRKGRSSSTPATLPSSARLVGSCRAARTSRRTRRSHASRWSAGVLGTRLRCS